MPSSRRNYNLSADVTGRQAVGAFGNSDCPQRRLSNRLEPSSHEFRLAVKLGLWLRF